MPPTTPDSWVFRPAATSRGAAHAGPLRQGVPQLRQAPVDGVRQSAHRVGVLLALLADSPVFQPLVEGAGLQKLVVALVEQRLHPVGGVLLPEAPKHLGLVPPLQGHHGSLYTSMLFAMASCSKRFCRLICLMRRSCEGVILTGCLGCCCGCCCGCCSGSGATGAVAIHRLPQGRRGRSPAAAWACSWRRAVGLASSGPPWALGLRGPQQRARPPPGKRNWGKIPAGPASGPTSSAARASANSVGASSSRACCLLSLVGLVLIRHFRFS